MNIDKVATGRVPRPRRICNHLAGDVCEKQGTQCFKERDKQTGGAAAIRASVATCPIADYETIMV